MMFRDCGKNSDADLAVSEQYHGTDTEDEKFEIPDFDEKSS